MAQINIDTPFKHCNDCEYLAIEYEATYAYNAITTKYFYCKYAHICKNAVKISEKEKETK